MITYWDIHIWSWDLRCIEQLEEALPNIDSSEAELYSLEWDRPCIANDIIYHMQYNWANDLDISDKSKEKLIEAIYTNCIDSWFDIDIKDFPKKERKIIQEFVNIF